MADNNHPKKTNLAQMKERRAALKKELEELQVELEDSLDDIKDDVTSRMEPKYWIQHYPLQSFGVSLLLGFLAGNVGGKKREKISRESLLKDSMLWSELKRALTRKAVQKIIAIIDSKIDLNEDDN